MTTELVVQNPGVLMTQATDVAGVCREIVKRTAQNIKGKRHVRVEGWQSIAASYGCVASATNVRQEKTGIAATGELRRVADGVLIATAEGFVGDDETMWASRPEYARRAMAQTRAISRVCRSAFAFVVVLIDGNLSTTPAEEMAYEHDQPAGGESPPVPPPGASSGPTETRTDMMKRLCKEAGLNMIDCLAKVEVQIAEDMAADDWASFCRLANKKIASAAK